MTTPFRLLRTTLLAAAAASVVLVSACASPVADAGNDGNTEQHLTIGLSADVSDLKPARDQGAAAMILDTLLHRGLLAYNADAEVVPALAESFTQVDDVSYSFTLREGLTFHDGTPLTSANVKNTLEYLAIPENGAKVYGAMSQLDRVETPNERTAIVHLRSANVAFPQYLADATAAIVPDSALAAGGTAWVGAGPYILESNDKGISFGLAKNPNFFAAETVKLETITLAVYADGQARTNALIAGDVDLIGFVPWENFDRIESTPGLKLDAQAGPFMYVQFNVTDGPFADMRVRRAVALAVNRENVASAAFSGKATVLAGAPIPTDSEFFDEDLAGGWATDVEQARALLAEAGYPNGFSTTLLASSQYSFHQDTALSVQADLQKIGITAELDAPDWATRQEKAAAGDYDLAIGGSAGVVNDPSFLTNFVSGPPASTRSFGFDDAELNRLLADGLTAEPGAKRKAAYDLVQQRILDTVPFASLVQRSQAYGYTDRLTGFANIPGFLTFESGYTLADASLSVQ